MLNVPKKWLNYITPYTGLEYLQSEDDAFTISNLNKTFKWPLSFVVLFCNTVHIIKSNQENIQVASLKQPWIATEELAKLVFWCFCRWARYLWMCGYIYRICTWFVLVIEKLHDHYQRASVKMVCGQFGLKGLSVLLVVTLGKCIPWLWFAWFILS